MGGWKFSGGLAVVGDHADLLGTLGAAIDHLFTHERRTAVALGAGLDVLGREGGERCDGAERDDEERKDGFSMFALLFGVGV